MQTSKARREAATLFCVVFLLGVVLGVFGSHVWAGHVSGQRIEPHKGPHRDQIISNFTRELELTPAQEQRLAAIIDSTQAKVRSLYTATDAQRDQIRKDSHEQIRAI